MFVEISMDIVSFLKNSTTCQSGHFPWSNNWSNRNVSNRKKKINDNVHCIIHIISEVT